MCSGVKGNARGTQGERGTLQLRPILRGEHLCLASVSWTTLVNVANEGNVSNAGNRHFSAPGPWLQQLVRRHVRDVSVPLQQSQCVDGVVAFALHGRQDLPLWH